MDSGESTSRKGAAGVDVAVRHASQRNAPDSRLGSTANGNASPPVQDSLPSNPDKSNSTSNTKFASGLSWALLPEWLGTLGMFGLIFGGCCSNVFALEAIIKEAPASGTLITCFQFLLTAALTLPTHLDYSRGIRHFYLKPRAIPFRTWIIYTAFFITVNVLNNKAFDYKISVPLHIILRSAGPVATMIVQRLAGKRFEGRKVAAVILLFGGVVLAAIADARSKSADVQLASIPGDDNSGFWIGFAILSLALMLSAVMGVYTDRIYAKYGRHHTEENLFYSHTLSLPFFLLRWPELQSQTATLMTSPPSTDFISAYSSPGSPYSFHTAIQHIPIQMVFLLVNGLTQFFCIRGVNQLSAQSSSLTVSIVLNIRKLVSLMLSIWLFGNQLATGVIVGAALVFLGGGLYALPGQVQTAGKRDEVQRKDL